jgi:hypothetical protein
MDNKDLIIDATIISAFRGTTKFDDKVKNRLSLQSDTIPYDQISAFDKSGAKLTPGWFKEKNGYMNIASNYNIAVKLMNGRTISFEDFASLDTARGSKIKIKVRQTEGAIYPIAFVITEDGVPSDPFEGL